MKLRSFFLYLFFGCCFHVFSQTCATKLMPNYKTLRQKYLSTASSPTLLPHDTCLNKNLSIVFYVVLDSNYQTGVTPAQYSTCINTLNKYFKPLCITFMNCSTVVIPEWEYNEWDAPKHEPKIVGNYNWYTEKTINIYLVNNIVTPAMAEGYAYMPGGRDLIVMKKSALTNLTPVHEMGHFFGLPHTFAEISTNLASGPSLELVDLSNSGINGDGFYDTDADPYVPPIPGPCPYTYGPKDANNQYYVPPVDNIMSYWGCRCRFTLEQYNWMAYMYLTQRSYLH